LYNKNNKNNKNNNNNNNEYIRTTIAATATETGWRVSYIVDRQIGETAQGSRYPPPRITKPGTTSKDYVALSVIKE
jgi:hypothetical protein